MPDNQQSFDFDRVTFDLKTEERRKEERIAQTSFSRKQLLEIARLAAVRVARRCGEVTYDDVFADLISVGVDPIPLGNAAGCVFRVGQFVFTGRWRKSQRVSNHGREVKVWQVREEKLIPLLVPKKKAS